MLSVSAFQNLWSSQGDSLTRSDDSGWLYPSLFHASIAGHIQAAHLITGERDVEARNILPQLLDFAAGDDRKDHRVALAHPGNNGLRRAAPGLCRYGAQYTQPLIGVGTRELGRHLTIRARVRSLQKNGIAYERNPIRPRIVFQIFTDEDLWSEIGAVARTQVGISLLHYRIAAPLMDPADRVRFRNAPYGKIAGADGPHFARLDQTIQGFHGFFERRVAIVAMRIVKVDPIRLQPFQALLAFALDLRCA